jgi:hypothetical protein
MHVRRSLVASIAVLLAVLATAPAAVAATKVPTPISSLHSFAFTVKVAATGAPSALGSSLTLTSTGMFTAPANQDCTVTAALGKLTEDQQLVVVGKKTWVDSGSGLKPGKLSDFDFAEFCPSNKNFWAGFAVTAPKGVEPTAEMRDGIATQHYDAGSDITALSGFSALGNLPSDVTVSGLQLWFAARGSYLVSVQLQLNSASSTSCASLTDASPVPLQGPCAVSVNYDLSRPNDKTLVVGAPKTSSKK